MNSNGFAFACVFHTKITSEGEPIIRRPADRALDLAYIKTPVKELSQPIATQSARLRLKVDKPPAGTHSPNLADAVMMAYWPMPRRVTMWDVV